MVPTIWDGGTNLFEQALNVRSSIHEMIAANVANEETPGYRAMQLPFHKALDVAMGGAGPLSPMNTHPQHLGRPGPDNPHYLQVTAPVLGSGIDGNTVNLEQEMAAMAENSLLYMAVAQFMAGTFDGWRNAINEGR